MLEANCMNEKVEQSLGYLRCFNVGETILLSLSCKLTILVFKNPYRKHIYK